MILFVFYITRDRPEGRRCWWSLFGEGNNGRNHSTIKPETRKVSHTLLVGDVLISEIPLARVPTASDDSFEIEYTIYRWPPGTVATNTSILSQRCTRLSGRLKTIDVEMMTAGILHRIIINYPLTWYIAPNERL